MIDNREIQFEQNYSVTTCASALVFSTFFIGFIFLLNLIYVKQAITNDGLIGLFILFSYFILTSIVLFPILFIFNSALGISIKKLMKPIYIRYYLIGFLIFPAIMSLIPYVMLFVVNNITTHVNNIDFYFIYYATWISAIIQYVWILKEIKADKNKLNSKQIQYLKSVDGVDYF